MHLAGPKDITSKHVSNDDKEMMHPRRYQKTNWGAVRRALVLACQAITARLACWTSAPKLSIALSTCILCSAKACEQKSFAAIPIVEAFDKT